MAVSSTDTNSSLHSFQYWNERAQQSRARAEEMLDGEARALMLEIAEMYDRLAARAFGNFLSDNVPSNSK
jgi:hypothetical protein